MDQFVLSKLAEDSESIPRGRISTTEPKIVMMHNFFETRLAHSSTPCASARNPWQQRFYNEIQNTNEKERNKTGNLGGARDFFPTHTRLSCSRKFVPHTSRISKWRGWKIPADRSSYLRVTALLIPDLSWEGTPDTIQLAHAHGCVCVADLAMEFIYSFSPLGWQTPTWMNIFPPST